MLYSSLAPVVLFAYKRPNEFKQSVHALQNNYLAIDSELYVFIDGPKTSKEVEKVNEVYRIAQTISGFKSVKVHISEQNLGCTKSIINGISTVLSQHGKVIVVEDDVVTTPNFLNFINQGLNQYQNQPKVFSIGGYTFPFARPATYTADAYLYGRTCAWGWGIWADRWFKTDWSISDFDQFMADASQRKSFNYYGSDRVSMLSRAMKGEIDSWDIRLCYSQFKEKGLTIFPVVSKTYNVGFNGNDGTNTNNYNRYKTVLDSGQQVDFHFPQQIEENSYYTNQLRKQFSIEVRILNRVKTYLFMRR